MLTNIIATITVAIITTTNHPKMTVPKSIEQPWEWNIQITTNMFVPYQSTIITDAMTPYYYHTPIHEFEERDNPDVRIVKIRKIRTLTFECEGKPFALELENTLLSKERHNRTVETKVRWEIVDIPVVIATFTNSCITADPSACITSGMDTMEVELDNSVTVGSRPLGEIRSLSDRLDALEKAKEDEAK